MFDIKLNNSNTILNSFLYIAFAGIISFIIGYIHHKYFYSTILPYHADSGTYYVLAKVIFEEKSILVDNFFMGIN